MNRPCFVCNPEMGPTCVYGIRGAMCLCSCHGTVPRDLVVQGMKAMKAVQPRDFRPVMSEHTRGELVKLFGEEMVARELEQLGVVVIPPLPAETVDPDANPPCNCSTHGCTRPACKGECGCEGCRLAFMDWQSSRND